ncbi:hypothetical protein [Acidiphilium sp. PA]|uniref:hypothetical protein n=1 Tax=Acidiphilium sp. PA TaxID=2871705 RepID=UPI0022442709|nr:hypothetical protein [Acidiphilium sp. PA]
MEVDRGRVVIGSKVLWFFLSRKNGLLPLPCSALVRSAINSAMVKLDWLPASPDWMDRLRAAEAGADVDCHIMNEADRFSSEVFIQSRNEMKVLRYCFHIFQGIRFRRSSLVLVTRTQI